jgi:hypothetical protein
MRGLTEQRCTLSQCMARWGSHSAHDPSRFESIFKEICALAVDDDGLRFDPASVKAQRIKEDVH